MLTRNTERLLAPDVEQFLRQMTAAHYEIHAIKAEPTRFACEFREWTIEVSRSGANLLGVTRVVDQPGNRIGEPSDWPNGLDPHALYGWWDIAIALADPAWRR